jgi:metal-responsive CopG/Arc/MetJ family transcriptional regulator
MTMGMKTAISLPDELFASADSYARRCNKSRSEVFAEAVREYLHRHDDDPITEALDAALRDVANAADPALAAATKRVLKREPW